MDRFGIFNFIFIFKNCIHAKLTVSLFFELIIVDRYAAGASVQVLLFSVVAIQIKRVAPDAHTFLEIIRCRYGLTAHKIFLVFGLTTNVIVTAMLILGGTI